MILARSQTSPFIFFTFITSFVRSFCVHKEVLPRVILAAIIETTDFRMQISDLRARYLRQGVHAPQFAIYNLKLGTRPKGGSPKDKS
jgi:hypothetical protein